MSTLTAGQIEGNWDLITVTDTDRSYGYDSANTVAQVATTAAIAAATMGMGCAAAQGSRIAGAAIFTLNTLEAVNAVTNIGNGIENAIDNGLNLTNGAQIGMGLLTIGSLKATACFTAETQVVFDNKLKDKVYFTETTESQSFDEVNILFTFAGLSSAFLATAITLKKRKRNKSISSKTESYLNKMPTDGGLIYEIDETQQSFSLRKWFTVSLLLLVTIICGYFALPTTKTVAVTKSVEQVRDGYVTKNIEDIKTGDEVFAYNILTGEVSKCKVTDTFERTSDHLRYLTVNDSKGAQVFETTDSHPFWVVTDNPDLNRVAREIVNENDTMLYHENIGVTEQGYWVEAKDLKAGDIFLGANGELSILVSTKRIEFPEGITVYNFAVDGNHDYFVITKGNEFRQTCILVHNAKNYQLPGIRKITLNESHILSGHKVGGTRISINSDKDIFPSTWSDRKILNTVREAYINGKVIKRQIDPKTLDVKFKIKGIAKDGTVIEMWFNKTKLKIESAWPKF